MTTVPGTNPIPRLVRPMLMRDPAEEHRTSTNLELFFDLVFVVSVGSTATELHHSITSGHIAHGVLAFFQVMFGVWWAWMGFTWFANFFDVDDVPYRLLVLLQIIGSLGLAAGIPRAYEHRDYRVMVGAYVVIRLAMSAQWMRAAHANPPLAKYCRRWAFGIWICQAGWVAFAFSRPSEHVAVPLFAAGAVLEMLVPAWASSLPAGQMAEPHGEHAEERYGLFTIIVLGEMVLTASNAFNSALADTKQLAALVVGAICSAVLAFCLWWLYFGFLGQYDLRNLRTSFIWGYGHYFVFAALTAVGASLSALLSQVAAHDGALPAWGQALTLAIPVAVFVATIALLRQASEWANCNRWLLSAAAIGIVSTLIGSVSAMWALAAACATTAAFLASEIIRKGRAARAAASVR